MKAIGTLIRWALDNHRDKTMAGTGGTVMGILLGAFAYFGGSLDIICEAPVGVSKETHAVVKSERDEMAASLKIAKTQLKVEQAKVSRLKAEAEEGRKQLGQCGAANQQLAQRINDLNVGIRAKTELNSVLTDMLSGCSVNDDMFKRFNARGMNNE